MSFMMDRATEAAASNLAEVRKLIESMTALVSSQQQQQQQQQLLQKQKELQFEQQQQEKEQAKQEKKDIPPIQQQQQQQKQQQKEPQLSTTTPLPQNTMQNWSSNTNSNNLYSSSQQANANTNNEINNKIQNTSATASAPPIMQALPTAAEATIEPLVTWLRLTFQDPSISGMVLQYKGFDGLWKCLLNRDDSLKRVLKQNLKNNTILQMRVPCEQDLLSSGYTDKRLLALTTKPYPAPIQPSNPVSVTHQTASDNNGSNNNSNSSNETST
ncbi:hypothetical protein G6F60_001283 [Rhizopus arrhizus]|nr:hypothetical protein G6F60_001283 [Rhizopus arrhizus]